MVAEDLRALPRIGDRLLLRTIVDNPVTFRFASTAPFYVEIGPAPRRVARQSVTFFRDWVDERIARIKKTVTDARQRAEILRDHEAARTSGRSG